MKVKYEGCLNDYTAASVKIKNLEGQLSEHLHSKVDKDVNRVIDTVNPT